MRLTKKPRNLTSLLWHQQAWILNFNDDDALREVWFSTLTLTLLIYISSYHLNKLYYAIFVCAQLYKLLDSSVILEALFFACCCCYFSSSLFNFVWVKGVIGIVVTVPMVNVFIQEHPKGSVGKRIIILSINGGGVHGLILVTILHEHEAKLQVINPIHHLALIVVSWFLIIERNDSSYK